MRSFADIVRRATESRTPESAGGLDHLTERMAARVSRRALLKGALATSIATTLGIGLLEPLPVLAVCSGSSGNTCNGPCGYCSSHIQSCCSPNGVYCYQLTCTCNGGCNCSCFYAQITVCNDGSYASNCPCDCLFCIPNCGCCP
jgi:hypothetical protein